MVVAGVLLEEDEEDGEDSPNHLFTVVLRERDVDDAGLASELDIFDMEADGSGLGSAKKVEVKCKSMWLILLGESRLEMGLDSSLERQDGQGQ